MKKKRTKSPYRWPFVKHRMDRIAAADSLVQAAGDVVAGLKPEDYANAGGEAWIAVRRCARRFERAASFYALAGLGAAAAKAFHAAAQSWDFAGASDHAAVCRDAANAIDVFVT